MDWTTGVWYEFNDEEVTVLIGGPTSSFDTGDTGDGADLKSKVSGSEDAYNLFYVEEGYLSTHCEREFDGSTSDLLAHVEGQRKERFRLELE